MLLIWAGYGYSRHRRNQVALEKLTASREAGLMEPASLHPVIDRALCLGSGACVDACPEGQILGLLRGKSTLVEPTSCIGHGACQQACAHQAISLVLGTATRGVEIPRVNPNFESNVSRLYIAGELGGMGLIRNAIIQGCQAMDAIAESCREGSDEKLDVLIVGAGPAGIAASLRARELGLRCVTIEQDSLGGTVAHFPRGKIVMTAPVHLPLFGPVKFRETTKEELLELWTEVVKKTGVEICFEEELIAIERRDEHFQAITRSGEYTSRHVLMAIGRRGTPRKLGVPGEESTKVVYRLAAPEQYRGQRVLVVGGGDSAIEAALSLAAEAGTETALSYRGSAFSRIKVKNRERLEAAVSAAQLQLLLESHVKEIGDNQVILDTPVGQKELANDAVIICAGGLLPTPLLRSAGIEIETHHGEV